MSQTSNSVRDELLRQLDQATEDYSILLPGNVNYPSAAIRMDAFASDTEWTLIIQLLAWARYDAEFVNLVQAYGNHLEPSPKTERIMPIKPPIGSQFWSPEGNFQLDLHVFSVDLNGQQRSFTFTDEDYQRAQVAPSGMPAELAFLRMLAQHADLLLPPSELLPLFKRQPASLLFSLDEWQLPDEAEEEPPSDTACFQEIADAVAQRRAPAPEICTEGANTDWRHWAWISD
ncbi:DUF7003 family protein [Saccharopolyspora sp. 5N708]|uniref:DUF7003 family protein n=1 Tax=Saccharopolyspora sp. 5N708 TaxID=3457424 RepID=UPI003FD6436C